MSSNADAATHGILHYLEPSVSSSLYRNGRVLTRRDADGSDSGTTGVDLEPRDVPVYDARRLGGPERRTLREHGFELLDATLARRDLDFFDHLAVVRDYYPDCANVVRESSGAATVFAFDHNIRSAKGKAEQREIRGGQQVQGPAHVAHGDYTLRSAPERVEQLAKPASGNDTLRAVLAPGEAPLAPDLAARALSETGRFAIINVWRNIASEPVVTHPLALCDGQTVVPEDLVVFEIHYRDRIGENYFAKYSDDHRWYYYPAMKRDEALLIKQWDSAGALARSGGERRDESGDACTFSFHSAFDDPQTPDDAPERWSIEVRCLAVFE